MTANRKFKLTFSQGTSQIVHCASLREAKGLAKQASVLLGWVLVEISEIA